MYYLASAFALNMLPGAAVLSVDPLTKESLADYLPGYLVDGDCKSTVGHQGTAEVLTEILGVNVPVNREAIKMNYGDSVYVAQIGVRLEEGRVLSKEELKDIPLTFWVVTVMRQ